MRIALLLGLALTAGAAEPAIAIGSDQPGNVFLGAGGTVTVSAAATGSAVLEDEAGTVAARAALVPGATAALVLPGPGWYQVRAEAGGQAATSAALALGRRGELAGQERSPRGFFSVATANPLAARAGGRWNRIFLDLTQVKAVDQGFAWAGGRSHPTHEYLAGEGQELPAGQEWIVCLGRIPDHWTTKPVPTPHDERWKFYPPRDWDRLAALMRWAIAGLPAAVRHIEVLNEPDANWRSSDEELVRYHTVVAEAAHAVRPDLRVLGPCLCSVKIDLLNRFDRLGMFERLDGVSIHPYVNGSAPEDEFIAKIDALRAWSAARPRPLPIYFTEFGWQTNPKDWQLAVDERTHARYTARSMLLLAARPEVVVQQLFCLLNARPGAWDAYSLLAADGSPRLGYAYAASAMQRLAGATGARELAPGGEARALLWRSGAGSGLALWSAGAATALRLPAPAR
ncbi:MAG: hypothetical protein L6R48_25525, partial [Planctomycetes bacterium]|nr:hypothetical protein [Planctomycetota bacterium]